MSRCTQFSHVHARSFVLRHMSLNFLSQCSTAAQPLRTVKGSTGNHARTPRPGLHVSKGRLHFLDRWFVQTGSDMKEDQKMPKGAVLTLWGR